MEGILNWVLQRNVLLYFNFCHVNFAINFKFFHSRKTFGTNILKARGKCMERTLFNIKRSLLILGSVYNYLRLTLFLFLNELLLIVTLALFHVSCYQDKYFLEKSNGTLLKNHFENKWIVKNTESNFCNLFFLTWEGTFKWGVILPFCVTVPTI